MGEPFVLDFAAKGIFRPWVGETLVLDGQDFGHIVVAHAAQEKFGIAVRSHFQCPSSAWERRK